MLLLMAVAADFLLPRSDFRRYLRLLVGMMLTLAVLEPVLDWLGPGAPGLPSLRASAWSPAPGLSLPSSGEVAEAEETVTRQIEAAFRARVAREVEGLLRSRHGGEPRAEVVLSPGGREIASVRVRIRPARALNADEWRDLRRQVAWHLGLREDQVSIREEG